MAHTPTIGLPVVICGDAHLNNFGLYGTPQRDIVLDINDFDEVTIGPWEWDLKRLTASVNVLGRGNGLDADERRHAVMLCVAGYRTNLRRFESMSVLDLWYLHAIADHIDITLVKAAYPAIVKAWPKADAILRKAVAKARKTDNARATPASAFASHARFVRWLRGTEGGPKTPFFIWPSTTSSSA
jgi:uncharacterized protein (DUF2252 family)